MTLEERPLDTTTTGKTAMTTRTTPQVGALLRLNGLHWIGRGEAWSAEWGIRLGRETSSRASATTIEERP